MRIAGNIGGDHCLCIADGEPLCKQHLAHGWIHLANEKSRNPDILTWDQAMKDCPNLKGWLVAIAEEIRQLEEKNCWVECLKTEAHKAGKKVIPCTWTLKGKRSRLET